MKFEGPQSRKQKAGHQSMGIREQRSQTGSTLGVITNDGHDLQLPQAGFSQEALGGEYRGFISHRPADWALDVQYVQTITPSNHHKGDNTTNQ